MVNYDVIIVSPTNLEAMTARGGGIEELDSYVAHYLSQNFNIAILSAYYKKFQEKIQISKSLYIELVHFPAIKNYPLKTLKELYYFTFIRSPIYSCIMCIKLCKMMKQGSIQLIIVHNGLPGLLSATIARLTHRKIIYSEGNTSPWIYPYLTLTKKTLPQRMMFYINLTAGRLICKFSTLIRAQSYSIKKGMINQGVESSKIHVISSGIDVDKFQFSNSDLHSNYVNIGFIGRLSEEKGVLLLLDVVKHAIKRIPNANFIILGDGYYKSRFLNLSNVKHIGWVNREQLSSWLAKIQIVLFFQREVGLAELEALASGKALIASNSGEMKSIIKHGRDGYLVSPSADDYIEAIILMMQNPHLRNDLSLNARKLALRRFDWKIISKEWLKLVKECVTRT